MHKTSTANTILIISIVVCAYVYYPGLYGPIVLDDWSNLGGLLEQEVTLQQALNHALSQSGPLARPISMLSFIANSLAGHELYYWKFTNLIIHIATGILIYFLTVNILSFRNNESKLFAAVVAAAWMLHPLHVSTVLYTVQRMTQLSALFVFAGLLAYAVGRKKQILQQPYAHLQIFAWLVLLPLGVFSKENALLFPVFIALLEIFIIQKERFSTRMVVITFVAVVVASAAILALTLDTLESRYVTRDFSLGERLLTEARVLSSYLGMIVAPALERMGFMHDGLLKSTSLLHPYTTLPSIALIVSLIVGSIFIREKLPIIGFGILFFFSGHLAESTILPLELKFEHRNYLPSFGIVLATACILKTLLKNTMLLKSISMAAVGLLIIVLFLRVDIWSSPHRLYYHIAITHPESERHAAAQARQYADLGEFANAKDRIKNFSSIGSTLQKLYIKCIETGEIDISKLKSVEPNDYPLDNYFIMGLTDIANSGLDNKCKFSSNDFLHFLETISKSSRVKRSNLQIILIYRAHYELAENNGHDAINILKESFLLDKTNPTPLFLGCEWILDGKVRDKSLSMCETALQVSNKSVLKKYKEFEDRIIPRLEGL